MIERTVNSLMNTAGVLFEHKPQTPLRHVLEIGSYLRPSVY